MGKRICLSESYYFFVRSSNFEEQICIRKAFNCHKLLALNCVAIEMSHGNSGVVKKSGHSDRLCLCCLLRVCDHWSVHSGEPGPWEA